MALGRWLDAAEADDDGEATAARPLVTVPIERRELGGRRAQHPVRRRPPHYVGVFPYPLRSTRARGGWGAPDVGARY